MKKLLKCENKDLETNRRCLGNFKESEKAVINKKIVCQNCYEQVIYWRNHKK